MGVLIFKATWIRVFMAGLSEGGLSRFQGVGIEGNVTVVVLAGKKLMVVTSPGVPVMVLRRNGEVERVTVRVSSPARRPSSAEADASVQP